MMELLGPMPKNFALAGKNFSNFFEKDEKTGKYTFKRIKGLKHYPLKKLLMNKYRFKALEADQLSDFLLKMLQWYPTDRDTA
jgi:serine/threonine-protein kinase SRPK3